jgi:hypothetical protein
MNPQMIIFIYKYATWLQVMLISNDCIGDLPLTRVSSNQKQPISPFRFFSWQLNAKKRFSILYCLASGFLVIVMSRGDPFKKNYPSRVGGFKKT